MDGLAAVSTLRVLFVDDEPAVLSALNRLRLISQLEWDCHFATSGAEAQEHLARVEIDVIVSDMQMPHMDGAQVLEMVANAHPNAGRVLLTGYSDADRLERASQWADQIVIKPCNIEDLRRAAEDAYRARNS